MRSIPRPRSTYLQSYVRHLLARLGLTEKRFTLDDFCERLAANFDLKVGVRSLDAPVGAFGGLLRAENTYVIFYRRGTSATLRYQIVFHEIAHLLLSHRSVVQDGQLHYRAADEGQAETLGRILLNHAMGWVDDPVTPDVTSDRLRALFE